MTVGKKTTKSIKRKIELKHYNLLNWLLLFVVVIHILSGVFSLGYLLGNLLVATEFGKLAVDWQSKHSLALCLFLSALISVLLIKRLAAALGLIKPSIKMSPNQH